MGDHGMGLPVLGCTCHSSVRQPKRITFTVTYGATEQVLQASNIRTSMYSLTPATASYLGKDCLLTCTFLLLEQFTLCSLPRGWLVLLQEGGCTLE